MTRTQLIDSLKSLNAYNEVSRLGMDALRNYHADVEMIRGAGITDECSASNVAELASRAVQALRVQATDATASVDQDVATEPEPEPEQVPEQEQVDEQPEQEPEAPTGEADPSLSVPCPQCNAEAGQPCVTPKGNAKKAPHKARVRAAEQASQPATPSRSAGLRVVEGELVGNVPTYYENEVGRSHRSATTAKLAMAIENATPDAQGCITLDADAFVAVGLGKTWARLPKWLWLTGTVAKSAAQLGYQGSTSRGIVTLTPIAQPESAEQAS